jgi:hypothetical protein
LRADRGFDSASGLEEHHESSLGLRGFGVGEF